MKKTSHAKGCFVAISLGIITLSTRVIGTAAPVFVVLSSDVGPYQEAFHGFQAAFGQPVPSHVLSEGEPYIPSGTRVIVAIGGKAALHPYPSTMLLIYCLAPGTQVNREPAGGRVLPIQTSPSAYRSVLKFKELQPALKRLAVLWSGDSIQDYIDQKTDVADRLGVEILSDRIRDPEQLPDHLRALKNKADAIWLPADASMVTPVNFRTIKEFCIANSLPFYAPSDGLVDQGAVASVSASFEEIGALAAQMAHQALDGSLSTDRVFPEKIHVSVNLSAAARTNLVIPSAALKEIERVVP